MNTAIFDLDQQRCNTQSAIAESLYIDGAADGFDGVRPTSFDSEYLVGYAAGCRQKLTDVLRQAERLDAESMAVEAIFVEF